MPKIKYPTYQTKCIDDCICPYCGHRFGGKNATNNDLDCSIIICPKCEKELNVSMSVEYMCTVLEDL